MAKTAGTLAAAKTYLLAQEGEGAIISMEGEIKPFPAIPTGSFLIDVITGIGGLPQGRIVEFYGAESSGKSTVLSSCAAQCQKQLKKPVLYLDYEHALDKRYMVAQGVDLSDEWFIYSQPDNMEQGLRIAEFYMESGLVGLVVADSVAAMMTVAEDEGEVGNTHAGGIASQARVMAVAMKKLVKTTSESGATLAFINQMRTAPPSTPFEKQKGISKETTPGGSALKFYASMRVKFTKTAGVKGKIFDPVRGEWDDGIVATKIRAEVVKNKMAPPFRKCDFVIRYGIGVDDVMSLVLVGVDRGLLKKSAGYITIPAKYHDSREEKKINGLEKVCNYFRQEHPNGFVSLEEDLRVIINDDMDTEAAKLYKSLPGEDFDEALEGGSAGKSDGPPTVSL